MNQQQPTTGPAIPVLSEEELAMLRGSNHALIHDELREIARGRLSEQLADRRHAAIELLQAFIERVSSKPSPKISAAMVERIVAVEELGVPHRLAALRKTN
jgi:hypothetical protein